MIRNLTNVIKKGDEMKLRMVVEERECCDNKVIYHLNIDEEANGILIHLSSLKTIKTNRVIKGTTLVSAFISFL